MFVPVCAPVQMSESVSVPICRHVCVYKCQRVCVSVCTLEYVCAYAGTNINQMMYRPASGVDLNDPDQLAYGSVGLPADLLPPGCPPYPGVDADFAQAPMLTYVPTL
jgi:hypothetical protein